MSESTIGIEGAKFLEFRGARRELAEGILVDVCTDMIARAASREKDAIKALNEGNALMASKHAGAAEAFRECWKEVAKSLDIQEEKIAAKVRDEAAAKERDGGDSGNESRGRVPQDILGPDPQPGDGDGQRSMLKMFRRRPHPRA